MSVTLQDETAEAICSALHAMRWTDGSHMFTFIGESDGNASTWFLFDYAPRRRVQIEVQRSRLANVVNANLKFPNTAQGFKVGTLTITIDTHNRDEAKRGTEVVIRRVLEISRDVIGEEGIAGKDGLAAHAAVYAPSREPDAGDEHGADADE